MSLSMYQASVPAFILGLTNLSAIIDKAAAHAKEKNIDDSVFVNSRIFPDMFPFSKQVQIACDMAARGAARLAGAEIPSFPDTETTFAELKERVAKAKAFVEKFTPAQIDGSEAKDISFNVAGKYDMKFTGQAFLTTWALPNFYFHITIAYAILRHNGIDVGKMDYLGKVQ